MSRSLTPLVAEDLRILILHEPACEPGLTAMGVPLSGVDCLGQAVSAWDNRRLMGCGGLLQPWPGVGTLWMVLTPYGRGHPVLTFRAIRGFLVDLVSKNDLWRLEATVRQDLPKSGALLVALGFQPEGVRHQYFEDRSNGLMYAWLREDD